MTKEELTAAIRDLLEDARAGGVVIIALLANEGDTGVRCIHNVVSDKNAGDIMAAVAPMIARGDA